MDLSQNIPTITGIVASVFTSCSLLPQMIKIIREKKAEDISYGMLGVLFAGLALWVAYGIMKKDYIIIISNAFSMLINIITTLLSLKYKK